MRRVVIAMCLMVIVSPLNITRAAPPAILLSSASFVDSSHGWVAEITGPSTAILQTRNGERSWSHIATLPGHVLKMRFVDLRSVWVLTESATCGNARARDCRNEVWTSANGGATWQSRLLIARPGSGLSPDAFQFLDAGHAWVVETQQYCTRCSSMLLRTSDGGMTWQTATFSLRVSSVNFQEPKNGRLVLTNDVTQRIQLLRSWNGGATWTVVWGPALARSAVVDAMDARRVWLLVDSDPSHCSMGGCSNDRLWRTVDAGRHWRPVPGRLHAPAYGGFPEVPIFITSDVAWLPYGAGAGPGAGGVARTVDGGQSWRRSLPQYQTNDFVAVGTRTAWLVGHNRVCPSATCGDDLMSTTDGGRSWKRIALPRF